ncbi:MAG: translation initiation factor IF-3, partial [Candidatus Omnitrophica bacterium]|nr:translation initiation factor IF-3 [Candidatus Omnitrophota bacterium]
EGLDLVEISPTAKPPVCRILDFGKYLYTLEKEEKQARKKQHVVQIKEIKLTSKIKEHDFQTKLRSAIKFLERGDKVKLTMFFRGREITHLNLGKRILERFSEDLNDLAEVEKNSGLEGRMIVILLSPKITNKKKVKTAATPDNAKTENQ